MEQGQMSARSYIWRGASMLRKVRGAVMLSIVLGPTVSALPAAVTRGVAYSTRHSSGAATSATKPRLVLVVEDQPGSDRSAVRAYRGGQSLGARPHRCPKDRVESLCQRCWGRL